jgi:hypothetical protein
MTLLQLDPPMPFVTDDGKKCTAIMALDYGVDWETIFLCGMDDSRELWWLRQSKLRMVDNITFGRMPRGEQ